MSTVANEVRACIRQDPYLREGLARDVISHAKLARWLRQHKNISGTEHAIISALRRLGPMSSLDPTDEAREAIKRLDLTIKSGMVAITIRRDNGAERRVSSLIGTLGADVPVLPSTEKLTVIVPREQKDDAIEALGRDAFEEAREGLSLFTLKDPTNRAVKTDAILGLISHELGMHGVNIQETYSSRDELRFLLDETDEQTAREAVRALLAPDP